MSTVVL